MYPVHWAWQNYPITGWEGSGFETRQNYPIKLQQQQVCYVDVAVLYRVGTCVRTISGLKQLTVVYV